MNDETNNETNSETKPRLPVLVSGAQIRAIVPSTFEEAWRIAVLISKAGMSPSGLETPEKVTIALLAGLEIGLPPMQAIQSIAVINNRPSLYGDGPIAIVRASGLLESIEETLDGEGDGMVATCAVKRRGDPNKTIRQFSVADARKAGLWGRNGPWTFYPQRMLAVRARAFALRDGFADVLRGLAIYEEQADIVKTVEPPKRTPPPAPNGKTKETFKPDRPFGGALDPKPKEPNQEIAHDPETGEIFDGEAFLTDLDGALASAKDKDELQTVFADFEVQANLVTDKQRLIRAHDLLAWHADRLARGLKT